MIKMVQIGEVETEMIGDIGIADVMNVYLRIGWGAETTSRIAFKPAEDLNTGDVVKITIEKIYEEPEPEPEPEPQPEAEEEAATCEEEETPKAECREEGNAGEATEEPPKVESGEEDTTGKT